MHGSGDLGGPGALPAGPVLSPAGPADAWSRRAVAVISDRLVERAANDVELLFAGEPDKVTALPETRIVSCG